MPITTQANRLLTLESALGFDVLLIESIRGTEALSRPYRYELTLLADVQTEYDKQVIAEQVIGNKLAVGIQLPEAKERHIHGIVSSFGEGQQVEGPERRRYTRYRAELVPWFELLKLSATCRFFQNKNVPDVIKAVFGELGYQDFRLDLRGSYTTMDYCCQYRETDFDFVSRLMEHEGIYYYFEHTEDGHTMVLVDSSGSVKELPDTETLRYTIHGGMGQEEDVITAWMLNRFVTPEMHMDRDYHFELQKKTLEVQVPTTHSRDATKHLRMYDYPGGYAKKFNQTSERLGNVVPEGQDHITSMKMEAEEAASTIIEGASNVHTLTPGYKIKVSGDDAGQEAKQFLVRSVNIEAFQAPSYISEMESARENPFLNTFTCIPAETTFRPPHITPKPRLCGPQSAWVVDENSPPKEEIWPDKFGRVRVRFQWDLQAHYSLWLRVAQPWAGKAWGHQWLPRVGDEVLVDFIDGDCDCPIVIGSLWNPDTMPPFSLPDNKTQSGIVTRTSEKGTQHEFNMLRFEDKRGGEQVMLRSQRRADVRVLASYYETTHANRHLRTGEPKGTEQGGNYDILVGGDHNVHVKGGVYEDFDKGFNLTVKKDVLTDVGANQQTAVKSNYELNAKQITIEALTQITLKVGASFITLDLTGITIQAPMVKINCGGSATGTSDIDMTDADDAALSDNGEPGYLKWLMSQPKGPGGKKHHHVNAQHGPEVTYDPATKNYRVNKGLVVDGKDPDFAKKALNDVAVIGTTDQGKKLLADLDDAGSKGKTVTISKRPPTPSDPLNAGAGATNLNDATPAGKPTFDGLGKPFPPPPAAQGVGTGKGSDSNVQYDPDQWPAPGVTTAPSDVILMHELTHADHQTHGTQDCAPRTPPDGFDTNEEFNTIGPENKYRDERGVPRRTNHQDL